MITPANSVHILWLVPQYVVMTMGEVMFSVTGLEFSFTQAPTSMKSVLQSVWLLTVAFGNLIVVLIVEGNFLDAQVWILFDTITLPIFFFKLKFKVDYFSVFAISKLRQIVDKTTLRTRRLFMSSKPYVKSSVIHFFPLITSFFVRSGRSSSCLRVSCWLTCWYSLRWRSGTSTRSFAPVLKTWLSRKSGCPRKRYRSKTLIDYC